MTDDNYEWALKSAVVNEMIALDERLEELNSMKERLNSLIVEVLNLGGNKEQ